jgi:hypothetical protein
MPAGSAYVRLYNQIYLSPGAAVARFDDGFVSAGSTYLHTDHLGSTRVCTDANGVSTGACDSSEPAIKTVQTPQYTS